MGEEIHEDTIPDALGIFLGVIEKEADSSSDEDSDGSSVHSDGE